MSNCFILWFVLIKTYFYFTLLLFSCFLLYFEDVIEYAVNMRQGDRICNPFDAFLLLL